MYALDYVISVACLCSSLLCLTQKNLKTYKKNCTGICVNMQRSTDTSIYTFILFFFHINGKSKAKENPVKHRFIQYPSR